jgi:UDP-GlcNAc:undecaprenyl-phosphate GlcNAc-1-phosphate transferase
MDSGQAANLLAVAAKALVLSLFVTPIIRDVFRCYDVVDQPGTRKVHRYPVPRVGGIGICIAYAIALLSTPEPQDWAGYEASLWSLLPAAAIIFATGLLDDFWNLRPMAKLGWQVLAAAVVYWQGLRIEAIGHLELPLLLSFPVTLFWLLLTTNALNLIDGLDGLCTGVGLVATLSLFAAAMLNGHMTLAYMTLPLAAALFGFLCYNFNPATVFLGDSGSQLIGFLLGCYGMIWAQKTAAAFGLMVPLLALSVPLLDVSLSILRRYLTNRPIFGADRGHIHHRLLDQGLSVRQAVGVLYLGAILAAVAAVLFGAQPSRFRSFALLVLGLLVWVAIDRLKYSEFRLASRYLLRGQFRQTLRQRVSHESLMSVLASANTPGAWWECLAAAGEDQGWTRLRWIGPQGGREKTFRRGSAEWTFQIALGEADALIVEGVCPEEQDRQVEGASTRVAPAVRGSGHASDLIAFSRIVQTTWAQRSPVWKRSDLPPAVEATPIGATIPLQTRMPG